MNPGQTRRFNKLVDPQSGRAVLVHPDSDSYAMSDSFAMGEFSEQAIAGGATGIVASRNFALKHAGVLIDTPVIMRVGTRIMQQIDTPDAFTDLCKQAVRVNMSAIVAPYSSDETLSSLANLVSAGDALGLPVIADIQEATTYTRPGSTEITLLSDPEKYVTRVHHCTRVAVEIGAIAIAAPYTGTVESFAAVTKRTLDVPVFATNWPSASALQNLQLAHDAVQAKAAGVIFNSAAFHNTDVSAMTRALGLVVHKGVPAEAAMEIQLRAPIV